MPTSVRLDLEAERSLARLSRLTGRSKSELIREAIRRLGERLDAEEGPVAYERLKQVIGVAHQGPGDRAARSEEILREMFSAKRAKR